MLKVYFGAPNTEPQQVFGCKGNALEKKNHETQCPVPFLLRNLDAMCLRCSSKSFEIELLKYQSEYFGVLLNKIISSTMSY